MTGVMSNVVPIILLILFGYIIRIKGLLKAETMIGIKKLVLDISLPAILFSTFLNMNFEKGYFLVILISFAMLCVFFLIGFFINKFKALYHPMNPFVSSAFCFGLLGIPLFGTVFGSENLGKISILGVGNELFCWLVYYNTLELRFNDKKFSIHILKELFKSPLLISIFVGMIFNILGFAELFRTNALLIGFYSTIQYIANLGTPLILLIIGFTLRFNKEYTKKSIKFVTIRMIVILVVGYLIKFLIIDKLIVEDRIFNYAYFTFLILPLPFSLPIFSGKHCPEYEELINNTVILSTMLCILIFIIFILLI